MPVIRQSQTIPNARPPAVDAVWSPTLPALLVLRRNSYVGSPPDLTHFLPNSHWGRPVRDQLCGTSPQPAHRDRCGGAGVALPVNRLSWRVHRVWIERSILSVFSQRSIQTRAAPAVQILHIGRILTMFIPRTFIWCKKCKIHQNCQNISSGIHREHHCTTVVQL